MRYVLLMYKIIILLGGFLKILVGMKGLRSLSGNSFSELYIELVTLVVIYNAGLLILYLIGYLVDNILIKYSKTLNPKLLSNLGFKIVLMIAYLNKKYIAEEQGIPHSKFLRNSLNFLYKDDKHFIANIVGMLVGIIILAL